jgi:PKD repeat protein
MFAHTRSFKLRELLFAAVALSVVSLCVTARQVSSAESAPPRAGDRIINGTNVPGSQFPTVGEVGDSSDATFYYCTGTLISPKHVLTAGHCMTDNRGALTVAQTAGLFRLNGVVYHSSHISVHPAWKGGNNGDAEGEFDAIVIELDTPVSGVTPSPLYRQAPSVGQLLTIAGYGEEGTGSSGRNGKVPQNGTIDFGTTPIDIVTGTYIKWNFENKQPLESNTAPGDSGGPAFITVNGVLTLEGITNGGQLDSAGYGDQSYDTRVDAIAAWIDQVTSGASSGGGSGGGTPGNAGPVIASSASVTPANPGANSPAQFTVSATDSNGDTLTYAWDFGDGAQGTGASVSHTYTANGTYTSTVTVSDGHGGSATSSATVNVGTIPIDAEKCKFKLNFRTSGRDTLDVTFSASKFRYSDHRTFMGAVDGLQAVVSVGGTTLDSVSFSRTGMALGRGRLRWDSRNGLIRYQLRNADLADLLNTYGAVNDDTDASVVVPFTIKVDKQTYSANFTFDYRARADISGQGR